METLLWLALVVCGDGDGDDPPRRVVSLSAREAVSLSLNHNLDVEVARYQPWIEEQNARAALAPWDHTAYASASGGERLSQPTNSLIDATRPETDSAEVTVGFRKRLPAGILYDLNFSSSRMSSNNPYTVFDPRWTDSLGASLTVPILRGGSTAANTSGLLVARANRGASIDQFEKSLGDSVFQVLQAYWDLVFAIENKKVKDQSLEVAQRLLEDNRKKLVPGLVAEIDVTQAEAGVASQQEGILTAAAAVQNAMDRLSRLVDPQFLKEEVALSPVDAPRAPEGELDEKAVAKEAVAAAMERRPEARQLRQQRSAQQAVMGRAENDRLPILDLTGRASVNGTDDGFSGAGREARTTDFREFTVGVVFEWPLEGSASKGAYHRADLEVRRLELQERNLQSQMLVEAREAVRAIKTNEKRIEATRRARVLVQAQLDGEEKRRVQGLSTTFRVLDVQEDLTQARTNEVKALIDYGLSLHRLDLVTGRLLQKNGIEVRDNLQPRAPR